MISTYSVIFDDGNRKREILLSPVMLHSKERPDIKPSSSVKLYFYEHWVDDEYKENVSQQKNLLAGFEDEKYLINFGQDFSKYYVGSLNVDLEKETYWDGKSDKLNDDQLKLLAESILSKNGERRHIIIFTPTPPSAFHLTKIPPSRLS
jgi:hypothetical protein